MTIVVADVEGLVTRRFASTLDPDDLDAAITAAVRHYSRYNPTYMQKTLPIVADVRVYDLPADFIVIDTFDWWPDGEVTPVGTRDSLWDGVYRQSVAELRASEVSPHVYFASGKIILAVTPTASVTVDYSYYSLHLLVAGVYSTIPTEDISIIADLATAEMLSMFGAQSALDPDYAEGLLDIKSRAVSRNIAAYIGLLREGVKARYGGY